MKGFATFWLWSNPPNQNPTILIKVVILTHTSDYPPFCMGLGLVNPPGLLNFQHPYRSSCESNSKYRLGFPCLRCTARLDLRLTKTRFLLTTSCLSH